MATANPQPIPLRLIATAIYVIGALCIVWPWMSSTFLFSSDEYFHTYNACVLEKLLSNESTPYSDWFEVNYFPEPNLLGHFLLLSLGKIMPYWVVEKVFVLLLVVANGYAFLAGKNPLTSYSPTSHNYETSITKATLALLALACWFGSTWQQGFVNYLLGMVAVLAGITHTASVSKSRSLKTGLWALFIYFCHPIALLFFIGVVSLRELLDRDLLSTKFSSKTSDWSEFLLSWLRWFALPLLLFIAYLIKHGGNSTLLGASPRRLYSLIYQHHELMLFSGDEALFAKGITLLIVLICVREFVQSLWSISKATSLAWVGAAVLLAAIIVAPNYMAGGAFIHQRLIPFFFIWALWSVAHLAKQRVSSALQVVLTGTVLALCIGLTTARMPVLAKAEALLVELKEFGQSIERGAVILPVAASGSQISTSVPLSLKPVLHHFAGALGCDRDFVLLDNYEAFVGYFPLTWKPGLDPFKVFTNQIEAHPANLIPAGKNWFQLHVDYILSLGPLDQAVTPETYAWMQSRVTQLGTSSAGNYRLYAVKSLPKLKLDSYISQ